MNDTEKNELVEVADSYITRDDDARTYISDFIETFKDLLEFCEVGRGEKPTYYDTEYHYDNPVSDLLIQEYIPFASGIGGSTSDYAANDIIYALESIGAYLVPVDIEGIMDVLEAPITEGAVYPEREFGHLRDAGIYL